MFTVILAIGGALAYLVPECPTSRLHGVLGGAVVLALFDRRIKWATSLAERAAQKMDLGLGLPWFPVKYRPRSEAREGSAKSR